MCRQLVMAVLWLLLGWVAASEIVGAEEPVIKLTAGPVLSQQMETQIAEQDALLFASIFDSCNAERVGQLVTDDFEFYHDKWGLTATSRQQFVESIAGMCKRIQEGTDFRARREPVANSMKVYPLNNFGAVQTGYHRFYALLADGTERLTETAQYHHVWKHDNGIWKLALRSSVGANAITGRPACRERVQLPALSLRC